LSTYQEISIDEMNEFMETRDFKQIVVPGTHEIVFAKVVKDKPDLELRLYSSVNYGGVSRGVGKDAIRFVIYSTKHCRGIGSDARVYRVQGWRDNMEKRLQSINEQVEKGLLRCRCGEWMVLREGKFGRFYGCVNYPDCKETRKGR